MQIIWLILIIIASLVLILKSADYIILSISRYAKTLGLSDAIIGLLVVSFATSSPELITSLSGLIAGNASLTMGTLIGNNMVHLALIMGLFSILGKKINLKCKVLEKSKFLIFGLFILPFILMSDGVLSRADGLLLFGSFITYLIYLWQKEGTLGKIKKKVKLDLIWRDALIFIGGIVTLFIASQLLVYGVIHLSRILKISTYFVALTVIGFGLTVDDLAVIFKSLRKKHHEIGLGNIIGSVMIEFLFFLGIAALIKPLIIPLWSVLTASIFLISSMGFLLIFLKNKVLTWKGGLTLVIIYLLFLVTQYFV